MTGSDCRLERIPVSSVTRGCCRIETEPVVRVECAVTRGIEPIFDDDLERGLTTGTREIIASSRTQRSVSSVSLASRAASRQSFA